VPGGLLISELVDAIRAVAAIRPIIGAGITECATDNPERLRVLVPILRAVGAALHAHSTTLPIQPSPNQSSPYRSVPARP
jgi:arginase